MNYPPPVGAFVHSQRIEPSVNAGIVVRVDEGRLVGPSEPILIVVWHNRNGTSVQRLRASNFFGGFPTLRLRITEDAELLGDMKKTLLDLKAKFDRGEVFRGV